MNEVNVRKPRVSVKTIEIPIQSQYSGKTILVTGGCGYIGSAISKFLFAFRPKALILVDRSECNIFQRQSEIEIASLGAPYVLLLGDICDQAMVDEIFQKHQPDIIFHAAAFKHVPLLEENPFEAARNNVIGTLILVRAAVQHRAERLLLISTDKAARPHSLLGATKRAAEMIAIRWRTAISRVNALRLFNVWDSPGSVVPLFVQQISRGDPVTVSHLHARRYFIKLNEAAELALGAAIREGNGEILVPKTVHPVRIIDIARQLILEAGLVPERDIPIVFSGLRPGDKLTEDLTSKDESLRETTDPRLYRIHGPAIDLDRVDSSVEEIADGVSDRNLAKVVHALSRLVTDYQPSQALMALMKQANP